MRLKLPSFDCSSYLVKSVLIRAAIIILFILGSALTGYFVAVALQQSETDLAASRYSIIAEKGLRLMQDSVDARLSAVVTVAKSTGYNHPYAADWPNVTIPGFYDTMGVVKRMARLSTISFLPIVLHDELPAFESFMFDYWDNEPAIPATAGAHDFGRGVWAFDPNNRSTTYHDITGITRSYNSTHTFLTPVLQFLFYFDRGPKWLGYNAHSDPIYGPAMDQLVDICSPARSTDRASSECVWMSQAIPLPEPTEDNPEPELTGFKTVSFRPVYLNENSSRIVGFIGSAAMWQDMIDHAFLEDAHLTMVVQGKEISFSYSIEAGNATFLGVGDHHDTALNHYQRTLNTSSGSYRAFDSESYIVYLYPTDKYFDQFRSQTSVVMGVVVALVIALVGGIFAMYDLFMRREADKQATLLTHKRQFVRFISHEIRTPLNSLHLGLELLTEELKGTVDQLSAATVFTVGLLTMVRDMVLGWQDLAVDMVTNSECAVDVLNDLLNYDKVEMGTLRLDFACVAIFALVEKCVKGFAMQARQKGLTLQLRGACWDTVAALSAETADRYRSLMVLGDHSRLSQILRNLLSNAMKFTPAEGTIAVTALWVQNGLPDAPHPPVAADQSDFLEMPRAGSIRVSVADNGVGLSEQQLQDICGEGVQFNANRLQAGQGSGLGLYISKGIAQQHRGNLSVTSAGLGQGSTFTLELPLYRSSVPIGDHLGVQRHQAGSVLTEGGRGDRGEGAGKRDGGRVVGGGDGGDGGGRDTEERKGEVSISSGKRRGVQSKNIMVVDDAVSNRKMLVRLLKSRGYVCEQVEDGQQALDLYKQLCGRGVELNTIVMDYEMPVMNGPTATAKLREMGCDTLIVGVTGNLLPEEVRYFKAQGADAVLGKPLDIRAFEELVVDLRDAEYKPGQNYVAGQGGIGDSGEVSAVEKVEKVDGSAQIYQQSRDELSQPKEGVELYGLQHQGKGHSKLSQDALDMA